MARTTPAAFASGPTSAVEAVPSGGNVDSTSTESHALGLHLLWIDDEIRPDDALLKLFRLDGVTVQVAACGADGLAHARASSYDAILLDLNLPDMFGLTLLPRLAASNVSIPVIIVSGAYLQPEVERDAICLGAAAFVHKPLFGVEDLLSVIRTVIGRSLPAQSQRSQGGGRRGPSIDGVAASFSAERWNRTAALLSFSPRELEIVVRLFDGDSEKQIADRLGLSIRTVHTHLEHLHHKLRAQNRAQVLVRTFMTLLS